MKTAIPAVLAPVQLNELLHQRTDVRLLDVRSPGEYAGAHIRGAYNVPLDTLAEHAGEIRAVEEPVVLICQSGSRARRAEAALRTVGMPNLHVLDGGLNGWVAAGEAVERGTPRVSLERQVRVVAGGLAASGALLALLVNPLFALLPACIGAGLVFAGVTDRCGMALLLTKLPYNRPAGCDVEAMVHALREGSSPKRADGAGSRSCGSCS